MEKLAKPTGLIDTAPENSPQSPESSPKKNRKILLILVGLLLFIPALAIGTVKLGCFERFFSENETKEKSGTENKTEQVQETANVYLATKRLIDPGQIRTESLALSPKISPYHLPIQGSQISNFPAFSEKVSLNDRALQLFEKNGFVVINTPEAIASSPEEFDSYYSSLSQKDIPVFITTDSLLHYYHVFFDTALMRLEKDIFYDDLWQMSKRFIDDQVSLYKSSQDPLAKEAARRNIAYLSVALELLKPKGDQVISEDNAKEAVNCMDFGDGGYCTETYEDAIENGTFSLFGQKELNQYSYSPPEDVSDLVSKELQLINEADGWECSPIFLYEEDYSQYTPRGHYTRSEKLKNYFLALMWYGRMTDLAAGSDKMKEGACNLPPGFVGTDLEGFVSTRDAQVQTLAALFLANKYDKDVEIQKKWSRIYAITAFFVGFSDDLGPVEYADVLNKLASAGENTADDLALKIDEARNLIKNDLPKPQIYGGLGNAQMTVLPPPPLTQAQIEQLKRQAEKLLENTQGFRLMGQREVIDSTIFSDIVSPYSGEYTGDPQNLPFTWVLTEMNRQVRGFPRGLDIMAIFGSKRAEEIISGLGDADYSDYQKVLTEQREKISKLSPESWYQNLYWNWLHVLRALLPPFADGYQTFMQTTAWQDKELNTALASWTELRHDTILYVKQSYTMAEMGSGGKDKPIVGYVEPVPEFYRRLGELTKMTNLGLSSLLTAEEMNKASLSSALNSFSVILDRLLDISKNELENKELEEEDYLFIKHFGSQLEGVNRGLIGSSRDDEVDPNMFKTTMVADVHTDGNTKKVLEEGVGHIRTLIVAYKVPDGRILIGAGPVFSYYEFKQPMEDRLTDEAWRLMLSSNPPDEPEWITSFSD
ncbi:DUF3160 domain-containing protein [Patescibacteria group bacterium]